MKNMDEILAFIALLLACYFVLCIIKPVGIIEAVLMAFCICAGCIIIWGHILSPINQLNVLSSWYMVGFITAILAGALAYFGGGGIFIFKGGSKINRLSLKHWYVEILGSRSLFIKAVLIILFATTVSIGLVNLFILITVAPHNWDSMTTHLPKMAQYYQQGNLLSFESANWAQVVQPNNSTLLFLFAFLVSGQNENLTQLVQYLSYWIAVICVFGIARKLGQDRSQAIFAALVSSLLIAGIVQTNTNLNDMVITACFGTTTYFLFAFRSTRAYKYLILAALGLGLSIGIKASSLGGLPSILLISLLVTWMPLKPGKWIKSLLIFGAAILLMVCAFALPSGYLENYRLFGDPIGNQDASDIHSFAGEPLENILKGGTYNLLRYGYDFISLDGLPSVKFVEHAQRLLRFVPGKVLSLLDINLEDPIAITFFPYKYDRLPPAKEGHLYWGVLGFGLVWAVVIYSVFQAKKNPDAFFLAIAAVIFLISISFSGPYDSSRGRYFSVAAIFAVPLVGIYFSEINLTLPLKLYLIAVILLGSVSAFSATIIKTTAISSAYPEILPDRSIFRMNRNEQLMFNNYKYYQPLSAFEDLVPADANVAVFLYPNTFEYPLFGKYLTRKIVSINSFYKGLLPIPPDSQYLLYAKGYPCALPEDVHLGADWYLRNLSNDNRECFAAAQP